MLLTATSTAATMKSLISPSDLATISSQVPGTRFTVTLQNTQASATLYLSVNGEVATSSVGIPLATNDSITLTQSNLANISLISSASTNTVVFIVNQ